MKIPVGKNLDDVDNSLDIVDMGITQTEFLTQFIGKSLTVWGSSLDALYWIEEFAEVSFTEENTLFQEKGVVLKGSSHAAFATECHKGFGFSELGSDTKYWIDKINQQELALIIYKRKAVNKNDI
jgi:hypothetical protein